MFNQLKKEAECSICIHTVKKPKSLPCLHSFCLDCLNKFAANRRQQEETTFDCPVCSATFPLPDGDKFDAFPTSFYLNRLLDILVLENGDTEQQKCNSCEDDAAATSFCFECKNFLCSTCLDAHNRLKVTRAHRRASLQNLQAGDVEELIQRPVLCEKQFHKEEPLEYYCQDCGVCICHKCSVVGHNQHTKFDIGDVTEQHKMQIIQTMEKIKYQVSESEQEMEKDRENFETVEQRLKTTRDEVEATVSEMIRVLKEHEADIMRQLEDLHKTQQEAHVAQQKNFELSLAQMNSSIDYIEAILKRNIGPEILQAQMAITERCEELLRGETMKANKAVNVVFVTNEELCLTLRQSGTGRVVTSFTDPLHSVAVGEGLEEAECGDKAEFTVITKDAEGQRCYYEGDQVTVHIQTATGEEVEVEIKDDNDGTFHVTYLPKSHGQHHVIIKVNGQPLTGSPWCVHVTPHQYQAISSFGSKGTGKGQFQYPRGVSVSSTGNIAVADWFNNRVQVFSSEGEYLKEFGKEGNASETLGRPLSVAYITPDHIVVNDANKKAFLFTESGQFIKHFSPVHLQSPRGISVTKDGDVIVCNEKRKRVTVLSSDGEELLQSFSAPNCRNSPGCAVYHKDKFLVSYPNSHCIKVFDVAGHYIQDIGSEGTGDGQFQCPRGVTIDMYNNLVAVDERNHRLQIFTTEGKFVSKIGGEGTELGQFEFPEDVAVSRDGRVYVTDCSNHRVQILR